MARAATAPQKPLRSAKKRAVATDAEFDPATTIAKFLADLDALQFAFPLATDAISQSFQKYLMPFVEALSESAPKAEVKKFATELLDILDHADGTKSEGKGKSPKRLAASIKLTKNPARTLNAFRSLSRVNPARELVARSFVLTAVSQFDAYVGNLIREFYKKRRSILNIHSKSLTYEEILKAGSVEIIERQLVDGEVESVLRKSHADQFDWLEKHFEIPLRKDLDSWRKFIELTERRNLFAHANARVSAQYVKVCSNHGVDKKRIEPKGKELFVSSEYFSDVYATLYEIGFKLGQVLWRKICPEDAQKSDKQLVDATYELIVNEHYSLAKELIQDFTATIPAVNRSDAITKTLILNIAQCEKWLGHEKSCISILEKVDWSASSERFLGAVATLKDDFSTAKRYLSSAIRSQELEWEDIDNWPIFRRFRSEKEYTELKSEFAPASPNEASDEHALH